MAKRRFSRSRSRRRVVLGSVPLEGRALLSASYAGQLSSPTFVTQTLSIDAPSFYVSQQASDLSVTIGLATDSTTIHDAAVGRPPTVAPKTSIASVPIASTNSVSVTLNATATPYTGPQVTDSQPTRTAFAPFVASVTFPPGVTSQTVNIPIPAGSANSGPVLLDLSFGPVTPDVVNSATQAVLLANSPSAAPPTISSAYLIGVSGNHASGIAIQFSKPMAAAVDDVRNYVITSTAISGGIALSSGVGAALNWIDGYSGPMPFIEHIHIKRAIYDPSTNTVDLLTSHRLVASLQYRVASPSALAGHVLTDNDGNPIYDGMPYNGSFSNTVGRNASSRALVRHGH